jgi:hypothetical protein
VADYRTRRLPPITFHDLTAVTESRKQARLQPNQSAKLSRNSHLGKKSIHTRNRVFLIAPLAAESPQKNRCPYDALASGATVYAYAGGDPVKYADPTGLFLTSVDAACMMNAGFCLEIMGHILENHAAITGDPCEAQAASSVANGFQTAAAIVGIVQLGRAAVGITTVIGKVADLGKLRSGEQSLLDQLPNLGSPKANWYQNSSVLRREMSLGNPIRDASVDGAGNLINNTGFLRAERNLLLNHGWTYDSATTLWSPPVL